MDSDITAVGQSRGKYRLSVVGAGFPAVSWRNVLLFAVGQTLPDCGARNPHRGNALANTTTRPVSCCTPTVRIFRTNPADRGIFKPIHGLHPVEYKILSWTDDVLAVSHQSQHLRTIAWPPSTPKRWRKHWSSGGCRAPIPPTRGVIVSQVGWKLYESFQELHRKSEADPKPGCQRVRPDSGADNRDDRYLSEKFQPCPSGIHLHV